MSATILYTVPSSAVVAPGQSFTIVGTSFPTQVGTTIVYNTVSGLPATPTLESWVVSGPDTYVTIRIPAGADIGAGSVVLTNGSTVITQGVTAQTALDLPPFGTPLSAPNQPVIITGSGFGSTTGSLFFFPTNGGPFKCLVTDWSATQIISNIPSTAAYEQGYFVVLPVEPSGTGVSIAVAGYTVTLSGLTGITSSLVGTPITISGAAGYGPKAEISGTAASITVSMGTVTLTGLIDMIPSYVGASITIADATTALNNGIFPIASYISSTSVTITNASAVTDVNNGHIHWTFLPPLTGGVNNGTFPIASFISSSSVTITNPSAVVDTNNSGALGPNPGGISFAIPGKPVVFTSFKVTTEAASSAGPSGNLFYDSAQVTSPVINGTYPIAAPNLFPVGVIVNEVSTGVYNVAWNTSSGVPEEIDTPISALVAVGPLGVRSQTALGTLT